VVGAGQGPRARLGTGCGPSGAAAAGHGRDPCRGALRQAGRGADLQAGLRVSPAWLLAGPRRWHRGGAGHDPAARQCRVQHRSRPCEGAGDGAAGPSQPAGGRSWSAPTPPAPPTPSSTYSSAATFGARSGSTATSVSNRRSWICPSRALLPLPAWGVAIGSGRESPRRGSPQGRCWVAPPRRWCAR
jgi:hypothetical protein